MKAQRKAAVRAVDRSRWPYPKPNQADLRLAPGNYAVGWSTNEGVRFQGVHGNHVLFVLDEAPGIQPEIWEAIEGARAGGDVRIVALGNPNVPAVPSMTPSPATAKAGTPSLSMRSIRRTSPACGSWRAVMGNG